MVSLFLLWVMNSDGSKLTGRFSAPSFVAAGSASRGGQRLIEDVGVLAFASTGAGRVLFTEQGAFFPAAVPGKAAGLEDVEKRREAGLPEEPQPLVVLAAGFASKGKRGVEPRLTRPLPGKVNLLVEPEEDWQVGLQSFGELVYPGAWPGVDLIFEARDRGLGYRLELAVGADSGVIELSTGAERLVLLADGSLRAERSGAWLHIGRPRAFQRVGEREQAVEVAFTCGEHGRYGFALGSYDPNLPLIIDPSLTWSSCLGGSSADESNAIAVDNAGAAYVTGQTTSTDFPTTAGAFDPSHNSAIEVFVSKFSPDGGSLVYSTYLGGTSFDYGYGIAVDSSEMAYITGQTLSSDFPTTPGAYDTFYNGWWAVFVSKLSADGSALVYSTYLGGSDSNYGTGIALDSAGSAFVTGNTDSIDFPITAGAFDSSLNGSSDGFVSKFSADGSALLYSTYFGGSGDDSGRDIALDGTGSAYVTGSTSSTDFPTSAGAYNSSLNGSIDVIVSKLDSAGSTLLYSMYLGGSGSDNARCIALDSAGSAYLTGYTNSTDFPTSAGAYDQSQNGYDDIFVSKLSSDGGSLVYSTFLGGAHNDRGQGIALNSTGSAYLTGFTRSNNFPVTSGAYDTSYNGGYDVIISRLSADGSSLTYSTYFGGSSSDEPKSMTLDSSGAVYVTGYTLSTDFPTTTGAYDTSHNGYSDGFISRLCPIAQPGAITGSATVCPAASAVTYSIAPVLDAVDYTWSVPAGCTIREPPPSPWISL